MTKKDPEENGPATVDVVRKWLSKVGYPLEMAVAKMLQEEGFRVTQSEYYRTSDATPHREIDIVGRLESLLGRQVGEHDMEYTGALETLLLVECKAIPNFVVFATPPRSTDRSLSFSDLIVSSSAASRVATPAGERVSRSMTVRLPSKVSGHGYAAKRLFESKNEDVAYDTIRDLVAASRALCANDSVRNEPHLRACRIVFPVIVVSAPLFACHLDAAGALHVEEVDRIPVASRHPDVGKPMVLVDIVTLAGLSDYANAIHTAFVELRTKHSPAIAEACARR